MADFWTEVLEFSRTTTAGVGSKLMEDFGQLQPSQKADGSLVTSADLQANREITLAIAAKFPDWGILSEEEVRVFPDREWCWVIDPVDGTTNFTRGIPLWGISLGLLYRGLPIFGSIYFPPVKQFFHGFWSDRPLPVPLPSVGAYLNDRPITVSADAPSSNHFFSFCSRSISTFRSESFPCKVRMLGVASYNLLTIAAGIALGGVEATPKVWDLAAVWVIVKAAGGIWVPLDDRSPFPLYSGENYHDLSFPTLIVSRQELVDVFQPLVQSVAENR